ncbi:hypothetical protein GCM10007276_12240 [Agaricicola taiwanensis]|uniref:Uncharacterized protein n=1 Tax=Agaricicola taiwanensis TaxID=591372 RepID=A0A8J2VPZ1_9RHOB|nr:hypothetical protein [Agaricicola taiwanensis]GGE36307.1 hypothetical protein GCM10007276_12240 [Agaricicola taiwanensis]
MPQPFEPVTAQGAFEVTPSDTAVFVRRPAALYIGGAGDVSVETQNRDVVTFVGVLAGSILPIQCRKVLATGTTATAIVGMCYGTVQEV